MARNPQKAESRFVRRRRWSRPASRYCSATRRTANAPMRQRTGSSSSCARCYRASTAFGSPAAPRLRRQLGLPRPKDFSDFNWEGVSFPAGFDRDEMPSCGFVERSGNAVLFGGLGNGKSHTAVALGIIAYRMGYRISSSTLSSSRSA